MADDWLTEGPRGWDDGLPAIPPVPTTDILDPHLILLALEEERILDHTMPTVLEVVVRHRFNIDPPTTLSEVARL